MSQPPFAKTPSHSLPAPLRGVFDFVARIAKDVFSKPLGWLARHLFVPIGHFAFRIFGPAWWLLAILIVTAGALATVLVVRRRSRTEGQRSDRPFDAVVAREDAGSLEAAAARAEAAGRYDLAVLLRFRAGLIRLETNGIIAHHLVTTDGDVRRKLRQPLFDRLAERHAEIAYADAPASESDSVTAREDWPRVLAAASQLRERGSS